MTRAVVRAPCLRVRVVSCRLSRQRDSSEFLRKNLIFYILVADDQKRRRIMTTGGDMVQSVRFKLPLIFFFLALVAGLVVSTPVLAAKPQCGNNICEGNESKTCPSDCNAPVDVCGDLVCGPTESSESCPTDCGPVDVCGDMVCGPSESYATCPADCDPPPPVPCNNDGVCNAGEDCNGCNDCAGVVKGKPANRYCCGLDTCDTGLCGADCGAGVPECGNGIVEYGEECDDGAQGSATCDILCKEIPVLPEVPLNQFNIGDSIGEGEAADGTIGLANHQAVWSTGYDPNDAVNSLNERFENDNGGAYTENNSSRDVHINQAVSGAVMADFYNQANALVNAMVNVEPGHADMVSILLGNNDVCADSLETMTDPAAFANQYRDGLDVLAASPLGEDVNLLIAGIPSIYWLWDAKRNDFWCRTFAWPFVPCQNLLAGAADDCSSAESAGDPDNVYPGDGSNCQRRKAFHANIRDVYNPILKDVLENEYQANGMLTNAEYVDTSDIRFGSVHVNGGDCFHPSKAGQALMATEAYCRSSWSAESASCSP